MLLFSLSVGEDIKLGEEGGREGGGEGGGEGAMSEVKLAMHS